jgi:hypothetical protein
VSGSPGVGMPASGKTVCIKTIDNCYVPNDTSVMKSGSGQSLDDLPRCERLREWRATPFSVDYRHTVNSSWPMSIDCWLHPALDAKTIRCSSCTRMLLVGWKDSRLVRGMITSQFFTLL